MLLTFFKNRKRRKLLRELRNTVRGTLAADDDILEDKTKTELTLLKSELDQVRLADTDDAALAEFDRRLDRILPRHGFAHSMRAFLDVLVVACSVAGGIRALYIQPFKIPTSSMQPTLFGIHYIDRQLADPHLGPVTRAVMPLQARRAELTVEEDGFLSGDSTSETAPTPCRAIFFRTSGATLPRPAITTSGARPSRTAGSPQAIMFSSSASASISGTSGAAT